MDTQSKGKGKQRRKSTASDDDDPFEDEASGDDDFEEYKTLKLGSLTNISYTCS